MYRLVEYTIHHITGDKLAVLSFDSMRQAKIFCDEIYTEFKAYPAYVNGCSVWVKVETEHKYRWSK